MNFHDTVMYCAAQPEFVREFDRLSGTNLSRRGSQLELAIDATSGRTDSDLGQFVEFVRDMVWDRCPRTKP